MTRIFAIVLGISTLAMLPGAAQAIDAPSLAYQAFKDGHFDDAVKLGNAGASADDLSIAAAARMAEGRFYLTGEERMAALNQAQALARRAIRLDPGHVRAHMVLAVALGAASREMGLWEAYFSNNAKIGRREIDLCLTLSGDSARARALIGEWHLEVVRRGGAQLAQLIYGAEIQQGIEAFEAAMAVGPDDPIIPAEFGLALIALGDDAYLPRAVQALNLALAIAPRDAYERLTLDQARKALDQLSRDDKAKP
jgi:tetratricopeptide (TPR) repeat protein